MSKILRTGLLVFCLLTSVAAGVKVKSWFSVAKCEKLIINRYKAGMGEKPTHVIEIGDANAIERLKRRIQSISADGEVMRSSIVDEEIQLSFECGDQKSVVEIYDGQFKTPTTGFNSGKEDLALEKQIYNDLKSLIEPKVGQRFLVVENLQISFPEFILKFEGVTVREQQLGEPTIGPVSTSHFSVKAREGAAKKLAVYSGQIPPQPLPFEMGGAAYVLYTFRNEAGERLTPDYFDLRRASK